MSDILLSSCCCIGSSPDDLACDIWNACAPQVLSFEWTGVSRQTQHVHGGLTFTLDEQVVTMIGTLTFDPVKHELYGPIQATLSRIMETPVSPQGGVVGVSWHTCLTCNGCPSCGACCESVYACQRWVGRATASGFAKVYCSADEVISNVVSTGATFQIDVSSMIVTQNSCTTACPWPCECPDPANADTWWLESGWLIPQHLGAWTGCVGAGLDALNASFVTSNSSQYTVDGEPYVSYMVIDPSLGYQSDNPLNIACMTGPTQPPPVDPSSVPYYPCDCSSTFRYESYTNGSLS